MEVLKCISIKLSSWSEGTGDIRAALRASGQGQGDAQPWHSRGRVYGPGQMQIRGHAGRGKLIHTKTPVCIKELGAGGSRRGGRWDRHSSAWRCSCSAQRSLGSSGEQSLAPRGAQAGESGGIGPGGLAGIWGSLNPNSGGMHPDKAKTPAGLRRWIRSC